MRAACFIGVGLVLRIVFSLYYGSRALINGCIVAGLLNGLNLHGIEHVGFQKYLLTGRERVSPFLGVGVLSLYEIAAD